MIFIKENIIPQLKKELGTLAKAIKLIYFTQEIECQFCRETRTLLEELVSLNSKLKLEIYNFVLDKEKVNRYKIDKIPAIVVEGEKDYGIRFFGIPTGYEFSSLIEACKMVSNSESGLFPESKTALQKITKPIHIQVFVTLTCPYCPHAVQLAHQCALENDLIRADMVESTEFPHLAGKYNVFSVPKIIINEVGEFEGALPEKEFIEKVLEV